MLRRVAGFFLGVIGMVAAGLMVVAALLASDQELNHVEPPDFALQDEK